ncbi:MULTISPECIES: hypothetical protein [Halomicrobium]|uniref:DUF6199 domain-containing protein n=2 Tax=Halomicrobium mukohataei TaxID=57705 RepID=C7NY83_HALMD|nr:MULTISPECIES: hypothetical protein [Halomicrobium]ACV48543.1 hypothetical protein Hmuk_2433 [Halomicrobium mukohataei DSM 12286]QCD66942.1 hypothetical protein E5139_15290 [Halomicrobium mukohataei]QFR21752.1 hypothetical protein GBQ70_15310 [Halomicrobium sp. ZPS1]
MAIQKLLPVTYAWLVVQGLLASLLPKQAIELNSRLTLSGFENPGDLEPKAWYVRATRVAGVGMLTAGLAGLLSVSQLDDESADTAESDAGESPDPIEVDIESDD